MIFGHVQHAETDFAWLPAPLQTALAHLKATDFGARAAGSYELQGRDIFVQIFDVNTRARSEGKPEIHRKYIDVQFLVRGRERIGVVSDNGKNKVSEDHLADRDVLFYEDVEDETTLEMRPGNFAILFPSDVHRPNGQTDHPEAIRKVVVKVAVALLK